MAWNGEACPSILEQGPEPDRHDELRLVFYESGPPERPGLPIKQELTALSYGNRLSGGLSHPGWNPP